MKTKYLVITTACLLGVALAGTIIADDDRYEHNERDEYKERPHDADEKDRDGHHREDHERHERQAPGLLYRLFGDAAAPASTDYLQDSDYALYKAECSECHMAYPPTMLPQVSWQALMATLDDHFGDNAELEQTKAAKIQLYLSRHSAGQGKGRYSERMWHATKGMAAVLRISDTDYFKGKHHEISPALLKNNPELSSFSQCQACHTQADKGSFDEHQVIIPGHGRWDD
jgi:hypothetical protein